MRPAAALADGSLGDFCEGCPCNAAVDLCPQNVAIEIAGCCRPLHGQLVPGCCTQLLRRCSDFHLEHGHAAGFHLYGKLTHFTLSCLPIGLAVLVGVALYWTEAGSGGPDTVLLFLLPLSVYDAGHRVTDKPVFNNMGAGLLLAVLNILWNTFGIGMSLWSVSYLGWMGMEQKMSICRCLVFSALISVVNPVAVLAIVQEIQVKELLYIIILWLALLSDGVTVMLHQMMEGKVQLFDVAARFFIIIILAVTLIGLLFGLAGTFITRYTDHLQIMARAFISKYMDLLWILEPFFTFLLIYMAYHIAETVGLSSILVLTFGGLIMKHYTKTKKSATAVTYFMKVMVMISQMIIFMFLGLSTIINSYDIHLDVILFSVLFCLLFRVTGVMLLSSIVNRLRLIHIAAIDQLIMSYGGLWEEVIFFLVLLLNKFHIPEKTMLVTTVTVFLTVFIQLMDQLVVRVRDIVSKTGHNSLPRKFDYYNTNYLMSLLLREKPKGCNPSIVSTFTKLSLRDVKTDGRAPSLCQFISCSPTAVSFFNRRASFSAQSATHHQAVVKINPDSALFTGDVGEGLAVQNLLEGSLFECRNTWMQERRHTLAQVYIHPRQQLARPRPPHSQKVKRSDSDTLSEVGGNNGSIALSALHGSIVNRPDVETVCAAKMPPVTLTSWLGSKPSDPEISKSNKRSPPPRSQQPTTDGSMVSSTMVDGSIVSATDAHCASSSRGICLSQTEPINIPTHQVWPGRDSTSGDEWRPRKKYHSDSDSDTPDREETLAESSLPWRRQTTLPPVPSSVSLSLPDDENPLMSEAPSWADNLAYSHLTESGSPYHSPQNTIMAKPTLVSPRPVFDIFPTCPQRRSDGALSSIPPPWSNSAPSSIPPPWGDGAADEPIPSRSVAERDSGDKAGCLLVSSHDLAPPTHHSCLQLSARAQDVSAVRRHSEVSSPTHFQFRETLSASALESQLIAIENNYHYGMADRVSSWLATSHGHLDDPQFDPPVMEEGRVILESLRQKKEKWILGDTDEGTDADIESDDELQDTKL